MYLYILPFKRRVHHMLRQKLEQLEGGLLTIFWSWCHDSQDPNRRTHIVNKTYICISTVKRFEPNFKWLILLSKIYVCMHLLIYLYRFGNTQNVVAAPRAGDMDYQWYVQRHLRSACLDNLFISCYLYSDTCKIWFKFNIASQYKFTMCQINKHGF